MIVIADASPINYFVLIKAEQVLSHLFDTVVIPSAVRAELSRRETPKEVRDWVANAPPWISFQSLQTVKQGLDLDPGETEAISLCLEGLGEAILIDDRKGRLVASKYGLATIGTISVLEKAAKRNLLSLAEAFDLLQQTNFRVSPKLLAEVLERNQNR